MKLKKHIARSYSGHSPVDPFIMFCFTYDCVNVRIWNRTRHDTLKWPMDRCLIGAVYAVRSVYHEVPRSRFVSGNTRATTMNCSLKKGMRWGVRITIAYQERACFYLLWSTNSGLPFLQLWRRFEWAQALVPVCVISAAYEKTRFSVSSPFVCYILVFIKLCMNVTS
jgi:hypothetical protein